MAVEHIIIAFLAAGVLTVCAVLGWRVVTLLQQALQADRKSSSEALTHMQTNYNRLLSKMEHWHEEDLRTARGHTERVLQFTTAEPDLRRHLVQQQTHERREEHVTQAAHSTNEHVLDAKEATMRGMPEVDKGPDRVRVPRSAASVNRGTENQGVIPQRHS